VVAPLESVDKFRYQWQGVVVFDGPLVELLIIIDGLELSTLLFDEEEWCCIGTLRRADVSLG